MPFSMSSFYSYIEEVKSLQLYCSLLFAPNGQTEWAIIFYVSTKLSTKLFIFHHWRRGMVSRAQKCPYILGRLHVMIMHYIETVNICGIAKCWACTDLLVSMCRFKHTMCREISTLSNQCGSTSLYDTLALLLVLVFYSNILPYFLFLIQYYCSWLSC